MSWTLVTGAAKGLGSEICRTLAKERYSVLIHYRESEEEAKALQGECKQLGASAEIVQADLSQVSDVHRFINDVQSSFEIENLINNVGCFSTLTLLETPIELWLELFQTNLHAPFALIQGLISTIKACRGSVINIGTAGIMNFGADEAVAAYSLSKRALYSLTKSLAKLLIKDHVRVNMVSPGVLTNSVSLPSHMENLLEGRLGELEEVCKAILFFLDKKNAYITGQNLEIAGGFRL